MRLVTYQANGERAVGARTAEGIAPTGYDDMVALIRAGERGLDEARARAEAAASAGDLVQPERILAPIPRPGSLLYMGVNFKSHGDEAEGTLPPPPTVPLFFSKLPSAVIGPGEPIVVPGAETQTDYEVELVAVIGAPTRRARAADALERVFGWTVANDVSARDVQLHQNQLMLGKGPDTFAPLGPELVTRDELPDVAGLHLSTYLGGERLQHAPTDDMIWSFGELIEYATRYVTLDAGDLVTSGTPGGIGYFQEPQRFLQPGDEVTVEVESVGRLTNPVVAGW